MCLCDPEPVVRNFAIVVAALFIFSLPAASQTAECQTSATPISEQPAQFQPRATEILLGRTASAAYETLIKLLCVDTVQEYVNRITQTVARGSNARVPITIKVVDSNDVNALSFPGGFLYINSGLILAVENEAEIASIVAHEIAHVVARDGMREQAPALDAGRSTAVTPIHDGVDGIGQIDGYLISLKYLGSRRETEADYNGIRYLQKSGYSPRALITFLERMQSKERTDPSSILRMFQSHPPTTERIQRIRARIGYPSAIQNPVADAELQRIKEILLARVAIDRSRLQPVPSTSH